MEIEQPTGPPRAASAGLDPSTFTGTAPGNCPRATDRQRTFAHLLTRADRAVTTRARQPVLVAVPAACAMIRRAPCCRPRASSLAQQLPHRRHHPCPVRLEPVPRKA